MILKKIHALALYVIYGYDDTYQQSARYDKTEILPKADIQAVLLSRLPKK